MTFARVCSLHYEKFSDGTVKCIEAEIPFEIPDGWAWARLLSIIEEKPTNGYSPKGVEYITDVRNLTLTATTSGFFKPNEFKYVDVKIAPDSKYWLRHNDILIQRSNSRELVGTSCIYDDKDAAFIFPDLMMKIHLMSGVEVKYIDWVLKSTLTREYYIANATGSASSMPKINQAIVANTLIPLPPCAEQKRLVRYLDEVMNISNCIETGRRDILELVSQAKAKILDLAIRGKLVPQDPADEPASVLLEHIRADKEVQIKAGKIKRDKKESFIFRGEDNSYYEKIGDEVRCIDDHLPFNIPENWAWARLGSIFTLLSGRDLAPDDYNDEENGIPSITGASNFMNGQIGYFRWTTKPQVVSDYGDLLLTCKGTVGELAINTVGSVHIARQIMAISGTSHFNQKYLFICIMAYISRIRASAKGLIPGISREDILELVLPIPPKRHQGLIVEKVDSLLLLLGTIEQSLK